MTTKRNRLALTAFLGLALFLQLAPSIAAEEKAGVDPADVVHTTGLDIPCESWRDPDVVPFAAILCIHGFGLNRNSYAAFGKRMASLGVPTYAIDLRGFGSFKNNPKYKELDLNATVGDVCEALKAIHRAHPDLPVILVGESMGGSVAMQAAASDQTIVDGLISSVPAGDRFGERVTSLKVALHFLRGPNKEIPMGKQIVEQATDDPTLRSEWESDPLSRMDYTPVELMRFQKFMNQTPEAARKLTSVPVLVLQGGSDQLVKPKGTAKIFSVLPNKNKDLVVIGTSEHLILEQGRFDDHDIDVVTSWIFKQAYDRMREEKKAAGLGIIIPEQAFKQAIGHLRLGQGLIELGDPEKARDQLLEAVRLGRGSPVARVASEMMFKLPKEILSARFATLSASGSDSAHFISWQEAVTGGKPKVVFFGARWIDLSKGLNTLLERAMKNCGDKVSFVRVDCDNPDNSELVQRFNVCMVPTTVFLNSSDEVVSYTVGSLDDRTLTQEILKTLPIHLRDPSAPAPPSGMVASAPRRSPPAKSPVLQRETPIAAPVLQRETPTAAPVSPSTSAPPTSPQTTSPQTTSPQITSTEWTWVVRPPTPPTDQLITTTQMPSPGPTETSDWTWSIAPAPVASTPGALETAAEMPVKSKPAPPARSKPVKAAPAKAAPMPLPIEASPSAAPPVAFPPVVLPPVAPPPAPPQTAVQPVPPAIPPAPPQPQAIAPAPTAPAPVAGKPSIIFFGSAKLPACQKIAALLDRVGTEYGERIRFININADDPHNAELLKSYGNYPLPAVLFMDGNNQISAYATGTLSESTLMTEILKLLSPGFDNVVR